METVDVSLTVFGFERELLDEREWRLAEEVLNELVHEDGLS